MPQSCYPLLGLRLRGMSPSIGELSPHPNAHHIAKSRLAWNFLISIPPLMRFRRAPGSFHPPFRRQQAL